MCIRDRLQPQPALDGGDGHGNIRLSAPALRARRHAALSEVRPRGAPLQRRRDNRPHLQRVRRQASGDIFAGGKGEKGRV